MQQKLSPLSHGITSKSKGDFYCLNCLLSFRTKNKLESYEKVCKNKDFCGIIMPSEKDKILEFNQYMKSAKMSYIIYADIKSLIKKKWMVVQIIQKNLQQQKLESMFLADTQCQQFGHLIT